MTEINMIDLPMAHRKDILTPATRSHFAELRQTATSGLGPILA